jgi:hypothetical protein
MRSTMIGLLPLIVAAAVMPMGVVMTLFWLRDRCGLPRAAGFAAGRVFLQLCQGVLFGYALKAADDAAGPRGADRIASLLLLMVGVMWLVTLVVTCFRQPRASQPPRWLVALRKVSALTAFGIGAVVVGTSMRQWFFILSAIAVIDNAPLNPTHIVLVYLYFVLAAQSLILAPVVATAFAPVRATRLLVAGQGWMERHKRGLTIAVSLVFGVWFCWQGIAGLLESDHGPVAAVAAAA